MCVRVEGLEAERGLRERGGLIGGASVCVLFRCQKKSCSSIEEEGKAKCHMTLSNQFDLVGLGDLKMGWFTLHGLGE